MNRSSGVEPDNAIIVFLRLDAAGACRTRRGIRRWSCRRGGKWRRGNSR
jgi:hypothetical protein